MAESSTRLKASQQGAAEAVNLARDIVTGYATEVTDTGIEAIARAVLEMDEALRRQELLPGLREALLLAEVQSATQPRCPHGYKPENCGLCNTNPLSTTKERSDG